MALRGSAMESAQHFRSSSQAKLTQQAARADTVIPMDSAKTTEAGPPEPQPKTSFQARRSRIRPAGALVLFASLAAALLLVAGCGEDEDDLGTLDLVSDPDEEVFEVVDVGRRGKTVGDVFVFDVPMLDPDGGEVVGHAYGTQTSLSLHDDSEVVQAMITYELGDGNQILIGGTAEYPANRDGLVKGEEYVRPILGGTGDYAGADGILTTVRQSDGSYEQTFEFGD